MRITSLIIGIQACLTSVLLANTISAQNINLHVKDAEIKQVFTDIERQANVTFVYNERILKSIGKVNINASNQPISIVLSDISIQVPLIFRQSGKVIGVSRKTQQKQNGDESQSSAVLPQEEQLQPRDISGIITDTTGKPVSNVTLTVMETSVSSSTDITGHYVLHNVPDNATIIISSIGYKTQRITLSQKSISTLNVVLYPATSQLQEVEILSNGYQSLSKERATGSFTQVDNKLFNRSVGPDILDRLDGITSGLIFNKNYYTGDPNASSISIRGLSTIYANQQPLIIVDNFPIDGDLNSLNPNDVESVTVLKDAAAASIWGARAGNGVIVVTTKKGALEKPLRIHFNTNLTLTEKPDAFYSPNFLKSSDFINAETFLFNNGFYDSDLSNTSNRPVISPVVEILNNERSGQISSAQANSEIDSYKGLDIRNDLSKYIYRSTASQQYAIDMSGGSDKATYYFSAGYDNDPASLVANNYNRLTLTSASSYTPVKNLTATFQFAYSIANSTNNNPGTFSPGSGYANYYPYAQFVGSNGNPLPLPRDYRYSYISGLNDNQLLDWSYNPITDIQASDNTTKNTYIKVNTSLKYTLLKGIDAMVSYQLENQNINNENLQSQQTYYTRNLINLYSQGDGSYPVPLGGILDENRSDFTGNTVRAQIDVDRTLGRDHEIAAIAGIEGNQAVTDLTSNRLYGYDNLDATTVAVDYTSYFNQYNNLSGAALIPYENSINKITNELFSYFANASETYKGRYILTASARIDQSNLFGVNANQKSVPLWSGGAAWEISKEAFYNINWLPYLKFRATYGYNGNIDRSLSAFTTAAFQGTSFVTGAPYAVIINPPNPELRWEKIGMANFALDFDTKTHVVSGSIDYFHKNGRDILGLSPTDPTTGVSSFQGNVASIAGSGFDIDITFRAGHELRWAGTLLASKATEYVTKYSAPKVSLATLLQGADGTIGVSAITPIVGKPVFAVYSYKWGGLTHNTGDPQGYVNGQLSTNYAAIESDNNISDAQYNGPARPTMFGGFRNTFDYKGLSLSWNITYELGFYFRRPSINYTNLAYSWLGNSDYALRWQQPGDELHTNVPSFTYPLDPTRDEFYEYSSTLVEKGDNVRLKDVSLSYDMARLFHTPFKALQVYGYANNLGILWKATKTDLDPDYVLSPYPNPKTFSLGVKATF